MDHDVFDLITRRDRTAIERMAAEKDTTPAALAEALLEATLRGIRQAGVRIRWFPPSRRRRCGQAEVPSRDVIVLSHLLC